MEFGNPVTFESYVFYNKKYIMKPKMFEYNHAKALRAAFVDAAYYLRNH